MLVIGANTEIFELRCVSPELVLSCSFAGDGRIMVEVVDDKLESTTGTITGVEVMGSSDCLVTGF